jgi:ABC-2 type transport system permease protein
VTVLDAPAAPSGRRAAGDPDHPGAGTIVLWWSLLRRDRLRIGLWWVGIVGLVAVSASSITSLYRTPEQLEAYARTVRGNSAMIIQSGPGFGLGRPTTGAVLMNEVGLWTVIAVGLMAVFLSVRHTRTEEETERAELVRAAPVGRHAPLLAATAGTATAAALVGIGCAVTLIVFGLPVTGSLAFGLSVTGAGLVFAGVGAVAAQIASGSRAALGIGGVALGLSFVLRAIGDVGNGVLSWLSPIGWAQAVRAFADERRWVLLIPVVVAVGLSAAAVRLEQVRDFGGGLVPQRLGPPTAAPSLSTPLALAGRLQRGALAGWTVGIALIAFFYGVVADQAETMIEENPEIADFFAQLGVGSVTDAFLATSILILALLATGFTITSVLRLRSEESGGLTDEVLAVGVSRRRLALAHLAVAAAGTVVLMAVAGAAIGAGHALVTGDWALTGGTVGGALAMVPAILVFGGLAMALYGIGVRWAPLVWALFAWALLAGLLASVLDLPDWAVDLSPFQHVPALPAAAMSWPPVFALLGVAGVATVVGLLALDRRDLTR